MALEFFRRTDCIQSFWRLQETSRISYTIENWIQCIFILKMTIKTRIFCWYIYKSWNRVHDNENVIQIIFLINVSVESRGFKQTIIKLFQRYWNSYKKVIIFERAFHKQLYLTIRLRARNFNLTIIHRSRGEDQIIRPWYEYSLILAFKNPF